MSTDPDDAQDTRLATPTGPPGTTHLPKTPEKAPITSDETEGEEEEDDEQDEEPKLKYTRLTGSLGAMYRSGDSTSASTVAGDKMVIGTHNGNINVFQIPTFQSLRTYNGVLSAAITSVSVSPVLPFSHVKADTVTRPAPAETPTTSPSKPSNSASNSASPQTPRQVRNASIPSNNIYIATSSMDGHVFVISLVDQKDRMLRNFARPVNAVALSPDYKNDRTYLSGGLAGNLILTVGGRKGVSANANTNSAAAAAQGFLGSIGLGSNTGTDKILHSGEGSINTIKWSRSGKFVVWVNEEGIKIMRSNLHLANEDLDHAWRRIAHIDRPSRGQWEDMAGVWKARCEWIDQRNLEPDEEEKPEMPTTNGSTAVLSPNSKATAALQQVKKTDSTKRRTEKLVVGWGDTAWVLDVKPESAGVGKDAGERVIGSANIVHQLLFDDCIISGLSLYTPSLLLILAYRTHDENDNPLPTITETTPRRGVHHRQTGLQPEIRLINSVSKEEIDVDTLTMSRYETLSAADYHLSTLYVPPAKIAGPVQKAALEALWDASINASLNATRLFSSAASIRSASGTSGENVIASPTLAPTSISKSSATGIPPSSRSIELYKPAATPGLKFFIQSPYDCVLAVKRDLSDHLSYLLEHQQYEQAFHLVSDHPEIVSSTREPSILSEGETPSTPSKNRDETLAEFFADSPSLKPVPTAGGLDHSNAAKETRRIGELWLKQLTSSGDWAKAGSVAGLVLGTTPRWEHWVWQFAQAGRFDEIAPYVPSTQVHPPLPSLVYEVILGHYIQRDRVRFKDLLEKWDTQLYDVRAVAEAVENKLNSGEITETSVEDGVEGRDWRILQEGLAKLYLADDRPRDALRCYIRLQNADAAMQIIKEYRLLSAVADDIPGFLMLRVTREQMDSASLAELEEACMECVRMLVDEAYRGTVAPDTVVQQLQRKGDAFMPFLFIYLCALWKGEGTEQATQDRQELVGKAHRRQQRLEQEGHALVEEFGDLAVEMFAEYDRPLLMEFLRASRAYSFEKAAAVCEARHYYPELVYLLSQTGQTKRALMLIIEKLEDVSFAISFAKEQNDKDLWDDLLEYSMDKPKFIRGLLEEVGTAIDPIELVKKIPEGLEIQGLRDGILRMVREYELQNSISEGVARVLRSEVANGMETLRKGRARAVKFEVVREEEEKVEIFVEPPKEASDATKEEQATEPATKPEITEPKPGYCAGCQKIFVEDEKETLIGFACGHVFHLSCLLEEIDDPNTAAAAERLQAQFAADAAAGDIGYNRSVGPKVSHAHIIKNAVRGGCPLCRSKRIHDG